MNKYKCHKEVWAAKISEILHSESGGSAYLHFEEVKHRMPSHSELVSQSYLEKHQPEVGGYYVTYADGYESYSPAEAFENGYSLITEPTLDGASPIMKHFSYKHLPQHLKEISQSVCELAFEMDKKLPDGPEKSAGLRKLLEAKDCLVRATI